MTKTKGKYRRKVVVVRSKSIEELLQTLWSIRPEIRDQLSTTVRLALAAFIRESQRNAIVNTSPVGSIDLSTLGIEPEPEPESVKEKQPHPDSVWG